MENIDCSSYENDVVIAVAAGGGIGFFMITIAIVVIIIIITIIALTHRNQYNIEFEGPTKAPLVNLKLAMKMFARDVRKLCNGIDASCLEVNGKGTPFCVLKNRLVRVSTGFLKGSQ